MTLPTHTPTPVATTDCPFCEQVLQRNQELEDDKARLAEQLEDQEEAQRLLDEVIRRAGMHKKPATFLEAVVAVCEDNHELRRQLANHRA